MKIKPPEEIFQMQDLYNNKGKTFLIKINKLFLKFIYNCIGLILGKIIVKKKKLEHYLVIRLIKGIVTGTFPYICTIDF